MVLLLIFFFYHQLKHTGFYTAKFGLAEMVALYLPILISMIPPILRVALGRPNPAQFADIVSDLCLTIGSIWLRHTFPFNFAHIADVFPSALNFAFGWLNDNVGRFILLLQIVIGSISALASTATYLRARKEKPKSE